MNRCQPVAMVVLVICLTGCNGNPAIANFAADVKQISDLLPRVAAIPLDSCVELRLTQQLNAPASLPDRAAAEHACPIQAEARNAIAKTYGVLALYMTVLGKLAGGNPLPSVQSVKSTAEAAAKFAHSNSAQQSAISGLAGAMESAYLRVRTQAALRNAITQADPHVQALCLAFRTEIMPSLSTALDVQEQDLRAQYQESASPGPVRLLLLRQYDTDLAGLQQSRALANRYSAILTQIAEAHHKLFLNRDRLRNRETATELVSSSAVIEEHLRAIQLTPR